MDTAPDLTPAASATAPAHKPTVLYVDDDEADIELFQMAVSAESEGAVVVTFTDADSALAYLRSQKEELDLIVLDLNLPKTDGITLVSEIQLMPRLRHTPVVMLSNSDDPALMLDAREAGASGYFVKPLDFQRYTRMVRSLLAVPDRLAAHRKTFIH